MHAYPELMESYAVGPKLLRDALPLDLAVDWDARPVEGMWSIREVVCHLADSEVVYSDRIKRVLAEHMPTLFDADPNFFIPALKCPLRNIETELKLIEVVRAQVLQIIGALEPADFERKGVHSTDGVLSLKELLERITGHIPHHLAFIQQKLERLS